MAWKSTKIAGRDVPIEAGDPIIVNFSAGAGGEAEAGEWAFWTIFNDEKICTARCRPDADPGERFRTAEGREQEKDGWRVAATAKGIRPAKRNQIKKWLDKHPVDAKFTNFVR